MRIRTITDQLIFREIARALWLALIVVALGVGTEFSQSTVENKKVLILYNNDSYTATQVSIDRALRSTLKERSPITVETYSEYVGDTRSGTGYEEQFVALLRQKY